MGKQRSKSLTSAGNSAVVFDDGTQAALRAALEVSRRAYAPYSNYFVGAALRSSDGSLYTGCNVENASYSATICAERAALVKAVSEGQRIFDLLVVVTRNGGFPCGACRQVLYEFAPDLRIVIADVTGKIHHDLRLTDLLPHGFGPANLV